MSDLIDRGPGHGSAVNGIGYGAAALALTGLLAIIFLVWCRAGETYDVENLASRCDDPVLGGDHGVQPVRDGWRRLAVRRRRGGIHQFRGSAMSARAGPVSPRPWGKRSGTPTYPSALIMSSLAAAETGFGGLP